MLKNMNSMIFAAGLGTRLKPITDTLPKALVPVNGRPLIELTCRKLMAAGINQAVVNIHHFADKIEDWAAQQDWVVTSPDQLEEGKMLLQFSDERQQLLETGGAVLHARRFLEGCGHFLIHNVDILSNADLGWLESQVQPEALAILLVSKRETTRFLLFHPDTMRLAGWHNTNTGDYRIADESIALEDCVRYGFSGIHILSDKVLGLMEEYAKWRNLPVEDPAGVKFSIMNFYLWAALKHPIYGVVAENLDFLDVGKLDTLEQAEQFIKNRL
jgi:NDP-sugar pyrophosphorylase family protein